MKTVYESGLVSIIAPCYNGAPFIDNFLKSLLSQKYTQFEVIFVDDGSTDNSSKIAEQYTEQFTKIGSTLRIYHKENGGLGSAINFGLKHVRGEFLTWLGIDDALYPDFFNECVEFLNENPDYAIVRPDGDYVSEKDPTVKLPTIVSKVKDKFNPYIFWNAVTEKDFHFGYSFMRTEVFEKENGDLDIYESREGQNWQLLLPVLYRYKSGYIDRPLYRVMYRPESVSNCANSPKKRINQLKEYNKILVETLRKMPNISAQDRSNALDMVNHRFWHRIFHYSMMYSEYQTAKEYYILLKENDLISKDEEVIYRKRYFKIEYWLEIKHRLYK